MPQIYIPEGTFRMGGMPRARVSGVPGGFAGAGPGAFARGPRRVRVQPSEIVDVTGEVVEERRPDAPRSNASRVEADVIEGEIVDE